MTDPLVAAFEEDHRVLTRGLYELRRLAEAGEWAAAATHAGELDRAVGAHIEFEEKNFYPMLRRFLGAEFIGQLYREHEQGRQALKALEALEDDRAPDPAQRAAVLEQLEIATSHALSCGTLVSHLETLGPAQRAEMLTALEACHQQACSWTSRGR